MLVASLVSMSLSTLLHGVSVKTWMLFLGESSGQVFVISIHIMAIFKYQTYLTRCALTFNAFRKDYFLDQFRAPVCRQ